MQEVDLFGIFSWEMSFPEGSSFFEGGNDIFAISEGSFFFEVETHFQTSCPTSAKRQVHAFLIVLLSHLHTELFQPFLNQKLTISLHGLCDIVRYILRKQTYHKECSDILAFFMPRACAVQNVLTGQVVWC